MFERIDSIFRNIEDIRDDINILLGMAKISMLDYIMIKRGSQDMPETLNFTLLSQIDAEVEKLKAEIDSLNKLKREMLIFQNTTNAKIQYKVSKATFNTRQAQKIYKKAIEQLTSHIIDEIKGGDTQ